jgi:hypothetical protein
MVEQLTFNQLVRGSSPRRPTTVSDRYRQEGDGKVKADDPGVSDPRFHSRSWHPRGLDIGDRVNPS